MLLDQYARVRKTTETLMAPLAIEDCVVQTSTECSPVKWHLAHTTWFFETFLLSTDPSYRPYHPLYGYLFNSYYNSIGDRTPRPARGMMSRPTMSEVMDYRRHVDHAMEAFIHEGTADRLLSTLELGLNHEQQHQELLLTDVKTVLGMNPLRPIYSATSAEGHNASDIPSLKWTTFREGLVSIGAEGSQFYFDNEGPRHQQFVERFEIANRLITNKEYKAFIDDGGYQTPTLWLSDGWARCQEERWSAPKYWEEHEGAWRNMTLQGFRPVDPAEPVTHISHFEADAFATWYGARLPTEFEWEAASEGIPVTGNFLDGANFHPRPLDSPRQTIGQMFGDVWQWTRSAYLPYPRYKPADGAIGEYNGKFMSNQMVLRGGSCVTPRDHIRATYRNFFPPESRWQFSGIRLARDV